MKTERGFTFLEIVISLSILVMIMSVSYGALTQIIKSKKLLDDTRENKSIADAILGRMTHEFQLASSEGEIMPPCSKPTSPLVGSPKLYVVQKGEQAGTSITFLALEGGQYIPDGGTHTGTVQITYRSAHDPKNPDKKSLSLIRDETPYQRPFDQACKKTMTFPITNNLVDLSFRFYDNRVGEWVKSWGVSPRTELPGIIEFSVTLKSPLGVINKYTSAVYLTGSSGVRRRLFIMHSK